jgi:hypothetical protein
MATRPHRVRPVPWMTSWAPKRRAPRYPRRSARCGRRPRIWADFAGTRRSFIISGHVAAIRRDGHALHALARWPPEPGQVSAFARFDGLTAGSSTGSPQAARQARRRPRELSRGTNRHPSKSPGPRTRPRCKPLRQDGTRRLTMPTARDRARLRCVSFHPCRRIRPSRCSSSAGLHRASR